MKNQSTNETCPLHVWKHEVQVAALALGGDADAMRESDINDMVARWYEAGEPVWMAADSLAFVSKQRAKANRAENEADYYKRMAVAYKETAEARAEKIRQAAPHDDLLQPFCACGRVFSQCDGSRRGCRK